MKFRLLAVSGLVAATFAVPRADAASRDVTWTFEAQRSSDVTLSVPVATEITVANLVGEISVGQRSADTLVTKHGLFGGLITRDAKGNVAFGLLRYAESRVLVTWGQYDSDQRQILDPGRYRVTVLGAAKVYLRVKSTQTRHLIATKPSRVVTRYDASDSAAAVFSHPLRVTNNSAYLALTLIKGGPNLPVETAGALCFTQVSKPACLNADVQNIGPVVAVGKDYEQVSTLHGYPHGLPLAPGNYEARLQQAAIGEVSHQDLFTLVSD